MGLFSKGPKEEPKNALDMIPSAADIDASEMLGLPLAEYERDAKGLYQPYAAYSLSVQGKNTEAEQALQNIIANGDEPNQWLARMELGTLVFSSPGRKSEGIYLLVQCLGAPYIDVARNAAWNIQEILRMDGAADLAKEYEDLAVALHSPMGMIVVAERLEEAGLDQQAGDAFEFAVENMARYDDFRPRAEQGLSKYRNAGVDAHAAEVYRESLGTLSGQNFASSMFYMNALAQFNSEAGSAAFATQYFGECEAQCYFEPIQIDCSVCGRNPSNYISVPSGDGDGAYPVFKFFDKSSEPQGAITVFRGLLQDLIDYGQIDKNQDFSPAAGGVTSNWAKFLGAGAPVYLGELQVDDKLIISDGSKAAGDSDIAIVVDSKPGKYAVICWLSAPSRGDNTVRPLALAAVTGGLRDGLLADIEEMAPDEVNALRKDLWGGDYTVFAHMGDIRHGLAINNFEMQPDPDENFEGLSWLLQQAEFGDDGLYDLIRSQILPDESTLRALLARRGIMDAKMPWFTGAPSASAGLSKENSSPVGLTRSNSGGLGGSVLGGGLGGGGLAESPANLAKFCGSCGNKFDGDQQKFCSSCGSPR